MSTIDPKLRDFILFCVERCGVEWPQLYDEMARVAAQRLYRGMDYNQLKQMGFSLSLDGVERTIALVRQATGGGTGH